MRIEETLRRAAGLFVEFDQDQPKAPEKTWSVMDAGGPVPTQSAAPKSAPTPAPTPAPQTVARTVEQVVREAPGPNLDEIKPTASPSAPVVDSHGNVNFASIYGLANLPASPFTAEQVLELLGTLPAELPIEAKRATVKITINAMAKATGVTTEAIVADASRKLASLAAYVKSYADQASSFTTKAEAEITALQAEIEQRQRAIEDAKTKVQQMVQGCTHETDRLDEVLEFFSLDVHPSKYAETPQ